MLKQALICATFVSTVTVGLLNAQQSPPTKTANLAFPQRFLVPGTAYDLVLGSVKFSPGGNHSANALLTALTFWASENSGLPANYDLPKVAFVSAAKLAELRYKSLLGTQLASAGVPGNSAQRENVAIYDDATRTIFLREGWTGNTPAELSILVHELIHHLQNLGQLKHECPQQRERLAYRVQDQWLSLFERNLWEDFEIDPFTLLVTTKCGY